MSKLIVVCGAQFGSEGKGHLAAWLANQEVLRTGQQVWAVRVAGPNAGHTVLGNCPPSCEHKVARPVNRCADPLLPEQHFDDSHPWRLRQVPTAAVSCPEAKLVIAAGSEIDLTVLEDEIHQLNLAGYQVSDRLLIDRSATVVEPRHQEHEQAIGLVDRIGSTGKGVGAARADRILRTASRIGDSPYAVRGVWATPLQDISPRDTVLIEGAQGYGLGLHTRFYPRVTSSDCRAIDFMAMAGVYSWMFDQVDIWLAVRPYPIRVAGNSGELAHETSWSELGLDPEFTTVTGRVRRVGRFDPDLVNEAIAANGGTSGNGHTLKLALMMADQLMPRLADSNEYQWNGILDSESGFWDPVIELEKQLSQGFELLGTGPDTMLNLAKHRQIEKQRIR